MIELFIASIVQGITEFIPVSSSLHLIIYSKLFSNKPLSLILISSMHMGSAIALIIFLLFDLRSKYKTFIKLIEVDIKTTKKNEKITFIILLYLCLKISDLK